MSEREQLTTVIQAMDEIYVSGIYKTVMETLAEMIRRQQDEDARDLQIVNETMARIESGEEELISREELLEELGLTEEDINNERR